MTVTQLPERPPISGGSRPGGAEQPRLGMRGLLLVVPIAVLLAAGAGGPEDSLLVLAPLVTYAFPLVAMVAFWWEDWPGTRLRSSWSGWVDTALVAVGAVLLTAAGQAIVGALDVRSIFDPAPGPGHVPTFPATMPLAGLVFVAMLELTLVGEGWPLRRLPRIPAGLAALAVSWAVALAAYAALAGVREHLGTVLILIGAWQVVFYIAGAGWPLSSIHARAVRLPCAHAGVIGAGIASYLVAHDLLGIGGARLGAAAGCFVAAGLLAGMLFEGWLTPAVAVPVALALAALLLLVLDAIAGGLRFTRASADDWVAHVGLNALGVAILLHVAIGRRWPFAAPS